MVFVTISGKNEEQETDGTQTHRGKGSERTNEEKIVQQSQKYIMTLGLTERVD